MTKLSSKIFQKFYLQSPYDNPDPDELFEHAVKEVPYYRQFKGLSFREVPFLTKEIIRTEFENLKSADLENRKTFIKTSGGSTGEPVRIIQDRDYKKHQRVVTYEQKAWCGYSFGEPMIHLWGNEKDILASGSGRQAKMINSLKNLYILNAFRMGEREMRRYLKKINLIKPRLLVAYVQPIYELALFAEKNNIHINPPGAIMTSAGTLYPFMKEKIESVFNTPVYNRYGTREVGNIACSGPGFEGLRISENNVFVEVVDQKGFPCPDDTEGEIVVTSLVNYAMPLIRYKIGDRGILNRSKYDFPVLKKLSGRSTEMFMNGMGEWIPAEYFIHLIGVAYNRENSWIKRFQVIQKSHKEILLKVVRSGKEVAERDKSEITEGIRKVMGNDCRVNFEFVDEIPLLSSGKYCYVKTEFPAND